MPVSKFGRARTKHRIMRHHLVLALAKRWKALQRWNYALFLVVVIHGIAYQVIENRNATYVILLAAMVLLTVVLQLTGFRERRRTSSQS